MISYSATFFSAVVISLLITLPLVWLLRFFKLGQPVREEGPAAHLGKTGTPTMGGLGFVAAILILVSILVNIEFRREYLALCFLIISYALIGLADDWLKIARRQNLGLTFWEKILSQTAAALSFAALITTDYLFIFWYAFIIVGTANATNLTDGLNGLLAGCGGLAFLAFSFVAMKMVVPEAATVALIAAGAVLAFLYFNFPKAQVFMGDVGSLAIGAALAGLAIILRKEALLILIGGVFVIEALSVILQVCVYKIFRRRIFKMSPLHHHFEMLGIKETWVTVGFWLAGLIFCFLGVLMP